MNQNFSIRSGTIGGTLTVLLINIPAIEIAKIAVSAAIGTIVSFLISFALKKLLNDHQFRK